MAEKITSIMATEVALDVTPANRSLRALKDSVNIVNKPMLQIYKQPAVNMTLQRLRQKALVM